MASEACAETASKRQGCTTPERERQNLLSWPRFSCAFVVKARLSAAVSSPGSVLGALLLHKVSFPSLRSSRSHCASLPPAKHIMDFARKTPDLERTRIPRGSIPSLCRKQARSPASLCPLGEVSECPCEGLGLLSPHRESLRFGEGLREATYFDFLSLAFWMTTTAAIRGSLPPASSAVNAADGKAHSELGSTKRNLRVHRLCLSIAHIRSLFSPFSPMVGG